MLKFDIITIFPDIFKSYFKESIIKRAQQKKLVKINIYNLRDFANDRHKTVDDRPYGGGAGMILKVEPLYKAVSSILKKNKTKNKKYKVVLFSAKGKKFNQKLAAKLSKFNQLILICGRYEGVDERVAKHIADMEISVGDYVLTGGELPAMILVDAITRLIPDVIKKESLAEESFLDNLTGEYPQYTRPEIFDLGKYIKNWRACSPKFRPPALTSSKRSRAGKAKIWRVPKILLSGHHKKIEEWRRRHRGNNN